MSGLEQAQGWASIATSAATILTLAVLIAYTRETYKLRRAAQEQNENAVMPIVMLENASDLPLREEGANMLSNTTVIRNLGRGAAFNIEVETLSGPNIKVEFRSVTSLAAGDRQTVTMAIWEEGRLTHGTAYGNIQRLFHNHQMVSHSEGRIRYSDVSGKQYQTVMSYHYDDLKKELTPRLARVEAVPEA